MARVSRVKVTDSTETDGYTNDDVINDVDQGLQDSEEVLAAAGRIVQDELGRVSRPAGKVTRSNGPVSSGWGAPAEERTETVRSPNLVLKDKGKRIVKLLDEMPPVKYKRHYLNSAKRYYTCPQSECPLCEKGVRASWTFAMNVVDMDEPDEVKTWTFGNEVATQLQSLAEEGALNDVNRYFQVYHEKIANRDAPATRVQKLKARDLQEDYGVEPLNESELEDLEDDKFGAEIVFISTRDYLDDLAVLPTDLPVKRARN
jgi:hypothetical protein